jgi:very-short-patch-repair endonuclease
MSQVDGIIPGQNIDPALLEAAKELRKNMTPQEKMLWGHLRANRMSGFHFRRQQIINGYIVDFYCHKAGLVIEVDGPIHLKQKDYDLERDEQLKSRGLTVIHIKNEEIEQNLEGVLEKIKSSLIEPARISTVNKTT